MADDRQHAAHSTTAPGRFATTQWSLVQAAGQLEDPDAGRAALEQLCQTYWYPVYAYIRRWGHDAEDARDLTQDFFVQLLHEHTMAAADRERGRFRSFLLGVLKRFLSRAHTHASAQKRGGNIAPLSWERDQAEVRYACEPQDEQSPDELFDRRWATTVLAEVFARLKTEYASTGRSGLFEQLRPFLLGDRGHPPWREVGAGLGLSESGLKSALHRLRWRFGALVRETIADTLAHEDEVEEELKHLLAVLSR